MSRHDLSDAQWEQISGFMPATGGRGQPWKDHRTVVNGIIWILRTGSPWRDLPGESGNWKTVYERFRRWTREGLWERVLEHLQVLRNDKGEIDWELFCIDGSVIRAHKAAAGGKKNGPPEEPDDHALGRSRGGFSSKIHLVCDSLGWIIAVRVGPGQQNECTRFEELMEQVLVIPLSGEIGKLAGDKGYSSRAIREWLSENNIEDVIARRSNESRDDVFDSDSYRRRNIVERTIGWLKEFRRIATRYEKLATQYTAALNIAAVLQYITYWLNFESPDTA